MARAALVLSIAIPAAGAAPFALLDGDIVFQEARSPQTEAIQRATHSRFSHMGMVFRVNGAWFVFEAIQPVTMTPLESWAARGAGGHYTVKRLRGAAGTLTDAALVKMREAGAGYIGRPYDIYFGWADDRLYCSELVWKVYRYGPGIELCPLRRIRDFDLSHPVVKGTLFERYGNAVPLDEPAVSPGDIFDSPLLETVYER
ncbi:MAG: YiiX family permuted papain-like enzyme [Spirochaetes bacterium]|nr:MAG: YiiX family permuted papain-like enzyme [Spirochaetota bacterium]